MKARVKLLLAGAFLVAVALRPAPAEALWCRVLPTSDPFFGSEEECEQYCYSNGCYSYFFDGSFCMCS
jgi:hypothetical protein